MARDLPACPVHGPFDYTEDEHRRLERLRHYLEAAIEEARMLNHALQARIEAMPRNDPCRETLLQELRQGWTRINFPFF